MIVLPEQKHSAFRDGLVALLREHEANLSKREMLALASHLVGQLIAMQDQRTTTPAVALQIVSENIEQGNREVIEGLTLAPLAISGRTLRALRRRTSRGRSERI